MSIDGQLGKLMVWCGAAVLWLDFEIRMSPKAID